MPTATVTYFGKQVVVSCDGKCDKAWGGQLRPHKHLSDEDPDDYYLLADDELGDAPADPGTYEGGHAKPASALYFPNKWCVRECERCYMDGRGNDYTKRVYNLSSSEPPTEVQP
jgi:hypothetical protein